MKKLNFIPPILVAFLIFVGLLSPVSAAPTVSIEPQITSVNVGDSFQVQVWISGLFENLPMIGFRMIVTWDLTQLQYNGYKINSYADWDNSIATGTTNDVPALGYFVLEMSDVGGGNSIWTPDRYWLTLEFRCLAVGSSPLNLPVSITDKDGIIQYSTILESAQGGFPYIIEKGTVNQVQPPPLPVGGILTPVNQLAVLTPYLALVGLVAAASTVYLVKRRKA